MSRSMLNQSQKIDSSLNIEGKQSKLIPLYVKNRVNQKFRSLVKNIKNSFGIVTCIGSESFYVFTRQMLLHLNFEKALSLMEEQEFLCMEGFKSQQFDIQTVQIQVNSPKKIRKQSLDQLETSFARANSEDIKNLLQSEMNQIESEYQQSRNEIIEKELQFVNFKKSNSSLLPQGQAKPQKGKSLSKNLIEKNQDTQSEAQKSIFSPQKSSNQNKKSIKFIDSSFHKDVQQFKESMSKKKIEEIMRCKGYNKVLRQGQQRFIQQNDILRIYNSKEIGTDRQKKPIEWLYLELKQSNNDQLIQTAYLLSSTIVYELPFVKQPSREEFEKEIRDYFQFYKKLQLGINRFDDSGCDMPQVVVVCPIEDSEQIESIKEDLRAVYGQIETYYSVQASRKNMNYYQSPYNQFQKTQSPSKSKLPPTPKRILPISHKQSNQQMLSGSVQKKKIRLQFRMLSQTLSKSQILKENHSRMRQITCLGRDIFNEQPIKQLCGNWVTSQCFTQLLQKLEDDLPHIDVQQFYELWGGIYETFVNKTMEEAVNNYSQKVNQLILGKQMISQSRIGQVHEMAKKETMRQLSQKKIQNSKVYIQSNKVIKSNIRLPSCQNLNNVSMSRNNMSLSKNDISMSRNNISHSRRISVSRRLVQSKKQLLPEQLQGSNLGQVEIEQQQLMNLVESRLEEQLANLSSKAKDQSLAWCRKYLSSQYQTINKKLFNNEIKSLSMYRQQMEFFRDMYKKKLENHAVMEYEMIQELVQFLFENLFKGIELLLQKERNDWKQKINKEGKKVEQSELLLKQAKRSTMLRERQWQDERQLLESRIHELESSLESMSSQLFGKSQELQLLRSTHSQNLIQKQHQSKARLSTMQQSIQELKKQQLKLQSDIVYLQSQLQKQQLLHQQTHENYEQILLTYKNNVLQLEKKCKELKQNKVSQEDLVKEKREKEELSQKLTQVRQEFQTKITKLETELSDSQKELTHLKQQHQSNMQLLNQKIAVLQSQKSQSEVHLQLSSQKLLQLESRLPYFNQLQLQVQQQESTKLEMMKKVQQLTSQNALLEQKHQILIQQAQQHQQKDSEMHNKQIIQIKEELQQLISLNEKFKSQLFVPKSSSEVQTLLSVSLPQQLIVKEKCKHCKENQLKLTQALKLLENLNQNYQSMKKSYQQQLNKTGLNIQKYALHTQQS